MNFEIKKKGQKKTDPIIRAGGKVYGQITFSLH